MRESDLDQLNVMVMTVRLHASWCRSLKDKRMAVQSLIAKIQHRFPVSVAETGKQDDHQTIVIGMAAIVPHRSYADQLTQHISDFIADHTAAEMIDEEYEIR